MADETKTDKVTLEELMVSTLVMTDATVKLLIAKGNLGTERANYLATNAAIPKS